MLKLLTIFSSFLVTGSTISSFNSSIINRTENNAISKEPITSSGSSELDKLNSWHNSLSKSQDTQAKKEFFNSMNITTTKSLVSNFDTYNIAFDDAKLQKMISEKLLTKNIYNIFSSKEWADKWTKNANALVTIPSTTNDTKSAKPQQIRAYEGFFYIQNNKMTWVDKEHPNPNITKIKINHSGITPLITVLQIRNSIHLLDYWYRENIITVDQSEWLVNKINKYISVDLSDLDITFEEFIDAVITEEAVGDEIFEFGLLLYEIAPIAFTSTNSEYSKYIVLNGFEKYNQKIVNASNVYHSYVQETFDLDGSGLDPNSIKPVPPINPQTTFKDTLNAFSVHGKTITTYYNYDSFLTYDNYFTLWDYLNSNETFDINKTFESFVGTGSYDVINYDFTKSQSVSVLKKYWNKWATVSSSKWVKNDQIKSSAELQMEVTDNPWNKTVYFNFKSILLDGNQIENVTNTMY